MRRRREALIEKDRDLRSFVLDRLAEGWTPEQIAGWLKAGNERRVRAVGCETIYAFIYRAGQKAEQLWRYLTRRHNRRHPRRSRPSRETIKDRVSIHERLSTPEPRLVIGRATSSSASAHGPCSFSMPRTRAKKTGFRAHRAPTRRYRRAAGAGERFAVCSVNVLTSHEPRPTPGLRPPPEAGYQRQPGGTISNGSTFLMSANMAKRQPRSRSICTRAAANRGQDVERAALALAMQTSRNISARFRPCSDPFP